MLWVLLSPVLGRCHCDAPAPNERKGPRSRFVCKKGNWTANYPQDTLEVLTALRVCGECKHGTAEFRRIGDTANAGAGPSDGGYLMCESVLSAARAAISVGIESRDGWGSALAVDYRIPVFQFDCTGRAPPCAVPGRKESTGRCGNLTRFHSVCVASDTQRAHTRSMTLREMATTALAGGDLATERALLLKVDPEGAEVGALEAASDDGTLASVSSIAVEIHRIGSGRLGCHYAEAEDPLGPVVQQAHPRIASMLRKLLRDFRVVHVHGNNFNAASAFGPFRVPAVVEVTLVRKDLSRRVPCANPMRIRGLDEPNAKYADYVDFRLPGVGAYQ